MIWYEDQKGNTQSHFPKKKKKTKKLEWEKLLFERERTRVYSYKNGSADFESGPGTSFHRLIKKLNSFNPIFSLLFKSQASPGTQG